MFYFDCRILPSYRPKDVLDAVQELADQTARTFGVEVTVQAVNEESSPPTPADAPVVQEVIKAVQSARGLHSKPVGIGGGTVAGSLRKKGFPCAVWSTTEESAHAANEYCRIANLAADAKVFAALMLQRP